MKIFVPTFIITYLSAVANASCEKSGRTCKEFSGQCSLPFQQLTNGDPGQSVLNLVRYGRYCGSGRVCSGGDFAKGTASTVDACDDVDRVCQFHDSCLNIQASPGKIEGTVLPGDCACELGLVGGMAFQSAISAGPTNLCDADYYSEFGMFGFGSEAEALFLTSCCTFLGAGGEHLCGQQPEFVPEDFFDVFPSTVTDYAAAYQFVVDACVPQIATCQALAGPLRQKSES